jgi:hypothetical protein
MAGELSYAVATLREELPARVQRNFIPKSRRPHY